MLGKMSGWLSAPKTCTFVAALCLGVAALAANFLGLDGRTALVTSSILAVGLAAALASIPVIISRARQLREGSVYARGDSDDEGSLDPFEGGLETDFDGRTNRQVCPRAASMEAKIQPLLSPLSAGLGYFGP